MTLGGDAGGVIFAGATASGVGGGDFAMLGGGAGAVGFPAAAFAWCGVGVVLGGVTSAGAFVAAEGRDANVVRKLSWSVGCWDSSDGSDGTRRDSLRGEGLLDLAVSVRSGGPSDI